MSGERGLELWVEGNGVREGGGGWQELLRRNGGEASRRVCRCCRTQQLLYEGTKRSVLVFCLRARIVEVVMTKMV